MVTDPTGKKPITSGQTSGTTPVSRPTRNSNLPSFAEVVARGQGLMSKLNEAKKEASTLRTESDTAFAKADDYRASGDEKLVAAVLPSTGKKDEIDRELFRAQKQKADQVFSSLRDWAEARIQSSIAESKFLASLDASSRASDYQREIGGLGKEKSEVLSNEQIEVS